MNYTSKSFYKQKSQNQIHIREFLPKTDILADILCVHGAIENGRIFYSENGKGLAPFLAKNSYRVWVPDHRGRGKSLPAISLGNPHHQLDLILDIIDIIQEITQSGRKLIIITHSWGGVLLNSALLRDNFLINKINFIVHFGVKKHVRINSFRKLLIIKIIWNLFSPLLAYIYGYLPAKRLRMGSDDESIETLRDSIYWVAKRAWVDRHDLFDYEKAVKDNKLPNSLFIAAKNDKALGEKTDVIDFMIQCGFQKDALLFLSTHNGHHLDYDHINMLTAKEAESDHFPIILRCINELI